MSYYYKMQVTPIQRIFSTNGSQIPNREFNEKIGENYIEMLITKILESKLQRILEETEKISKRVSRSPSAYSTPYSLAHRASYPYRTSNVIVPYATDKTTNWGERIIFFILGMFVSILFVSVYKTYRKIR